MQKENIKKIANLSSTQKGILYHSINEDDNSYIIQLLLRLKGNFEIDILHKAFDLLIEEYDVLRTGILYKKISNPVKLIYKEREGGFIYSDRLNLEEYLASDRLKGFDLERDPLFRIAVLKEGSSYILVITFHHIILDGWSKDIILKRLFEIYNLLIVDNYAGIQCDDIDLSENIIGEDTYRFWKKYLEDFEPQISLFKSKSEGKSQYLKKIFKIKRTSEIKSLCKQVGVSLNVFCLALWGIELQMLCNSDDIIYGSVISCRDTHINGINSAPGLFINTIPIRIGCIKENSFLKYLKEFAHQYYLCVENGKVPLNELIGLNDSRIDLGHLVTFEEKNKTLDILNGLGIEKLVFDSIEVIEHTQYGLTITFKNESELFVEGIYNKIIISTEELDEILETFQYLCDQILENPNIVIKHLKCVNVDVDTYWREYNRNEIRLYNTNIVKEFEKTVKSNPQSIALKDNFREMSYFYLNCEANYIAEKLLKYGIHDSGIAIYLKRSFSMISVILGILKSGNYYIPIEYNYPEERICTILEEAKPAAMICDRKSCNRLVDLSHVCKIINVEELIGAKEENIDNRLNSNSIAYMIYTSGTTGIPKGVIIEHESVIRIAKGNYLSVTPQDTILQLSNYAFDGSVFDIFTALLNGATLRIINENDAMDLNRLTQYLKQEISVLFITTALFNTIVENDIECLYKVRKILFGGERASVKHVDKAFEALGENRLIHVYGPTETTVFASFYPVNSIKNKDNIPIGYPIDNTHLYILNTYGQLQVRGRIGELYIAGTGLAKGYNNDSLLTTSKFIHPSFDKKTLMYKTNDLCLLSDDGLIEFVGRNDNQIKLRGYRIELGDIQNALLRLAYIKEAYVLAIEDNNKMLKICSYLVCDKNNVTSQMVRKDLKKILPEFMIPSKNVFLDKLPLNCNGKVDRKKLPNIKWEDDYEGEEVDIQDGFEKEIADIWCSVLNVKSIKYESEFYDLGGDSIKAIKIVSQINKLGYSISIKDLFANSQFRNFLHKLQSVGKERKERNENKYNVDYMSQYME